MCLEIHEDKIHKAKEDIICYKRLRTSRNGELESPFQYAKYTLGKTYRLLWFTGDNPRMTNYEQFRFRLPTKITRIHQGFHMYRELEYAKQQSCRWDNTVKCRIPKGTRYILGENEIVALKFEPMEIVQEAKESYY